MVMVSTAGGMPLTCGYPEATTVQNGDALPAQAERRVTHDWEAEEARW